MIGGVNRRNDMTSKFEDGTTIGAWREVDGLPVKVSATDTGRYEIDLGDSDMGSYETAKEVMTTALALLEIVHGRRKEASHAEG